MSEKTTRPDLRLQFSPLDDGAQVDQFLELLRTPELRECTLVERPTEDTNMLILRFSGRPLAYDAAPRFEIEVEAAVRALRSLGEEPFQRAVGSVDADCELVIDQPEPDWGEFPPSLLEEARRLGIECWQCDSDRRRAGDGWGFPARPCR